MRILPHSFRRALVPSLLVALAAILTACPPPYPCANAAFGFTMEFETDCVGAYCGFTLISGTPEIVGAIHPGEHAMRLPAGTTVRMPLGAGSRSIQRSMETLNLVARCDANASLVSTEELSLEEGGSLDVPVTVTAGTDWGRQTITFYSSTSSSTGVYVRPMGVRFSVTGAPGSSCTIDAIDYEAYANSCFPYDSGSSIDARDVVRDAPRDAPDASTTCGNNLPCAAGTTCLGQFPNGICSRACTSDRDCGSFLCVAGLGVCMPRCTPGALDCDQYGGACIPADSTGTRNFCTWSCFPTGSAQTPPLYPLCPERAPCNPYTGGCGDPPRSGIDDGGPCVTDGDCLGGTCVTEVDSSGLPTGWIGGYCLSFGRQTDIAQGQPVPTSNCPPGAGVVPINGEQIGDLAPCFRLCDTNADCRAGYQCDHLQPSSGTGQFFSNGLCLPVNCATLGLTCPAGYRCDIQGDAGMPLGTCAANASDGGIAPDAGVDASGD